ncbi:secreted protein [Cadophora sp. MPI-SDFR-AT-0126]|nr:secreted protein [Leotiomycetes sp. MPI-SDFR-AT-0126]
MNSTSVPTYLAHKRVLPLPRTMGLLRIVIIVLGLTKASCLAGANLKSQTEIQPRCTVDQIGSFSSPGPSSRPKFRFWLPDASVDLEGLAGDIKGLAAIGAGGVEFNNHFNYGGTIANPQSDWSIYGFGTEAYNRVLKAALEAAKECNLLFDLAMGPESGQGVPAEIDNPGLAYDLVSYQVIVPAGGVFQGLIPGGGMTGRTLVSVTTATILNSTFFSIPRFIVGIQIGSENYTEHYVEADSIRDVTHLVNSNGTLSLKFPISRTGNSTRHIVYASYYQLSGARACTPGKQPQNFLQNGSFAVDHFSPEGAKVTTDFLEKYVLVNGVRELMQETGKYIWEDSVEVPSTLYWTPQLSKTFKSMHKYDVGVKIMLLSYGNGLQFDTEYSERFFSDKPELDQGYISDYRATLTRLMTTYLDYINNWSHTYLGLEYSAQPGYGIPVDMLELIPHVDVPEDESLNFHSNIDSYRQFSGPANLAGKRVISNELGAVQFSAYRQTLPSLINLVKKAYAGGNNQMVFHGATYSHQFPNTTWPGYTPFSYVFAETHSRHQPAWEHGYADYIDFVARNNFVLQSGVPKRDIVIWNKQSGQNFSLPAIYSSLDLVNAGYSYDYLSPSNLILEQAMVRNGVLAPDGPAYKALVMPQSAVLTVDGMRAVYRFATSGLKVILTGGMPTQAVSLCGLAEAQEIYRKLSLLPTVHQEPDGPLAPVLASLEVEPLARVSSNSPWYTVWRDIDGPPGQKDSYVFVYNDGNSSEGSIAFRSTKTPYLLDAWTGKKTPILNYTVSFDRTNIFFRLAKYQSVIVLFSSAIDLDTPYIHVISSPTDILGFAFERTSGILAKAPFSSSLGSIATSDGVFHNFSTATGPTEVILRNWTMVVETWEPPSNLSHIETLAVKSNKSYSLPQLEPWEAIPDLSQASGLGYYSTSFNWNHTASIGAIIDFGQIQHTLRASINGHRLSPLDYTSARLDITEFLVQGRNLVEAVVATTLANVLRPLVRELQTVGGGASLGNITFTGLPGTSDIENSQSGMVGIVKVIPYCMIRLSTRDT